MMAALQPLRRFPERDDIVPAVGRIAASFHSLQREIVRNITPETATFESVVRPWAELENSAQCELGVIWMLQYAAPEKPTQDTVLQARRHWIKEESTWQRCEEFYDLLCAIREDEVAALESEDRMLLQEMRQEYKRCGCGMLSEADKGKLAEWKVAVEDLSMRYQRNIAKERGGLWFSPSDLDGVPQDELVLWWNSLSEDTRPPGMLFIPFSNEGTRTVLTHARRTDTRRRMYLADETRLAENVPLLEEILKARHAQARLLGYESWAEYRIPQRMAKTTDWVEQFLAELKGGLVLVGRKELGCLRHRRRESHPVEDMSMSNVQAETFPPWDVHYYQNLVEMDYKVDHRATSEFFPLDVTSRAMLDVFSSIFGLKFERMPQETLSSDYLWHETVQAFTVWDRKKGGKEFLGYLYFDLLWRENKHPGHRNVTMELVSMAPRNSDTPT